MFGTWINVLRTIFVGWKLTGSDDPKWAKERADIREIPQRWKASGANDCERVGNAVGFMMRRLAYMIIVLILLFVAGAYFFEWAEQRNANSALPAPPAVNMYCMHHLWECRNDGVLNADTVGYCADHKEECKEADGTTDYNYAPPTPRMVGYEKEHPKSDPRPVCEPDTPAGVPCASPVLPGLKPWER